MHIFRRYFTNADISQKLIDFNMSCNTSDLDIDTCCSNFEDIILSSADKTLRRPKTCSKSGKKINKKWFDAGLQILRCRLLCKGRLISKFPFDPGIKGNYYKLYRQYKKCGNLRKRTFKQTILNQLDELQSSDPKHTSILSIF